MGRWDRLNFPCSMFDRSVFGERSDNRPMRKRSRHERNHEMPTSAKLGDTVAVHYTGKLADGSVFDTSKDRDPLQFVLGQRRVIPGFDKAIAGMSPGEKKTAKIPADDAYGPRRPELIVEFARERIPPDLSPEIGQQLQVQTAAGEAIPAVVIEASDSAVTLDANHPLAGQDLTFEIELVEVDANA